MKKIEAVAHHSEVAFWTEVSKHYPKIKSGDFPPDASDKFSEAIKAAISIWVKVNTPSPLFKEFRRSKVRMSLAQYRAIYGNDMDISTPVVLAYYNTNLMIEEIPNGGYHLILENNDWISDNLKELERKLYDYYLNYY